MATPVIPIPHEEKEESAPAQIFLQPVAAPSILGLYGFAGATFMVAAHMAHWYGTTTTDFYLVPFAAMFRGIAQFSAGMWAFKARDAVATAMHWDVGRVLDRLWPAATGILEWHIDQAFGSVHGLGALVCSPRGHYVDGHLGSGGRKQNRRRSAGIPCRGVDSSCHL
jgi:hypothetical protein